MSDIKVKIGQQSAVKVISSISGGSDFAFFAQNVIGGIASVTSLNVSGISTFSSGLIYNQSYPGGIAYFDSDGLMVSTRGTEFYPISYSNYILTTDNFGIPTWSSAIDGGTY